MYIQVQLSAAQITVPCYADWAVLEMVSRIRNYIGVLPFVRAGGFGHRGGVSLKLYLKKNAVPCV